MRTEDLHGIRTRRGFFQSCIAGIETAALAHPMSSEGTAAELSPLAPKAPHFPGKAKNIIFLFMEGAPSQLDLFDPKPALQRWHGQSLPPSMTKDLKLAFIKPSAKVLGSSAEFRLYGATQVGLRTRIPDADGRARIARFIQGIRRDARDVWRRPWSHPPVCYKLPVGAAYGGARRALRHAGACQLG